MYLWELHTPSMLRLTNLSLCVLRVLRYSDSVALKPSVAFLESPYYSKPKKVTSWRSLKTAGSMPLSSRMSLTPQKLWLGTSKQGMWLSCGGGCFGLRQSTGNGQQLEMACLTKLVSVSLPVVCSKTLNLSLVGMAFPAPPEDALAPFQGYLSAALWQRYDGAGCYQLAGDNY